MTTEGWIGTWRRNHARAMVAVRGPQMRSIYDDVKFDGRVWNQAGFIAYCRELRKADALLPVQTVVVHHSATAESSYASQTLAQVARNWWNYYRSTKGWSGGPHGIIMSREPGLCVLNSLLYDGVHCSGNNTNSRGGEIVGNFTSVLPSGNLLANAVVWFAGVLYAGKMTIDALRYHRQYGGTACPGNKLVAEWLWFRGLVDKKLQEIRDTEPPIDPPPPPPPTLEERVKALEGRVVMQRAELDNHSMRLIAIEERWPTVLEHLDQLWMMHDGDHK